MNLTKEINQEIHLIDTDYFTLGEYIYMAMGLVKKHRVCIAVAYKIDYCIKKPRDNLHSYQQSKGR